jgi:hypothetical protein
MSYGQNNSNPYQQGPGQESGYGYSQVNCDPRLFCWS